MVARLILSSTCSITNKDTNDTVNQVLCGCDKYLWDRDFIFRSYLNIQYLLTLNLFYIKIDSDMEGL